MSEKESDLSIYTEALPEDYDQFRRESDYWFNDIPDMPYPGEARAEACKSYEHMLDALTKSKTEKRQLTPQDINQIFDADKQQLAPYIKTRPDNDYTLKNVLAIGMWYATVEFEKEEGGTPRFQAFTQVNSLIRRTIDLASSSQTSELFGK